MTSQPDPADTNNLTGMPAYATPGDVIFETDFPAGLPEPTPYPESVPGGMSNAPFILENFVLNNNPLIQQVHTQWTGPLVMGPYADVWALAQQTADPSQFYAALAQRYQPTAPVVIGSNDLQMQYLRTLSVSAGAETSPEQIQLMIIT